MVSELGLRNWYQSCRLVFLTENRIQLCSITETVRHLTRTVQRDWCEKLWWTCVTFFVQVSGNTPCLRKK